MTDRVKDIGANRLGLFYCIRVGLQNSSGSSVSLSQPSTELALLRVQSSAGLSIFVDVCCSSHIYQMFFHFDILLIYEVTSYSEMFTLLLRNSPL